MGGITQAVEAASQAPATVSPKAALTQLLDRNKHAIGASLPSGMSEERFVRLLLTAANTNPDLLKCDPTSFLAAGVCSAQLGLEPNDPRGLAYLVPFNDKRRGKVVQFIIGYRGMLELARRSGQIAAIYAYPVYEGDTFSYSLGLERTLEHVPSDSDEDPAKITHVYAVAEFVNGGRDFDVMTRKQVDKVRASSAGGRSDYGPWATHYAEMARKTVLRRLCKRLPQTVEMAQADTNDERPLTLSNDTIIAYGDSQVDTDTGEIIEAEVVDE